MPTHANVHTHVHQHLHACPDGLCSNQNPLHPNWWHSRSRIQTSLAPKKEHFPAHPARQASASLGALRTRYDIIGLVKFVRWRAALQAHEVFEHRLLSTHSVISNAIYCLRFKTIGTINPQIVSLACLSKDCFPALALLQPSNLLQGCPRGSEPSLMAPHTMAVVVAQAQLRPSPVARRPTVTTWSLPWHPRQSTRAHSGCIQPCNEALFELLDAPRRCPAAMQRLRVDMASASMAKPQCPGQAEFSFSAHRKPEKGVV